MSYHRFTGTVCGSSRSNYSSSIIYSLYRNRGLPVHGHSVPRAERQMTNQSRLVEIQIGDSGFLS
jgi:hypothetical protein